MIGFYFKAGRGHDKGQSYEYGRRYLGFAGAVQDVDERSSELFFSSQADGGFQSVTEQQVVGADVLCKLFVLFHRQDDDTLITSFDSHRRHRRLT